MYKILGAVALPLAVLLLSGCGGETTAENNSQQDQPAQTTTPAATTTYVTTKAFVASLQTSGPTADADPAPVPTADEMADIASFNNEFAIRLLQNLTGSGSTAFAVHSRIQQLAMLTTDANDSQKSQTIKLLAGNIDQEQIGKLLPDLNMTSLLNTASTAQDGGYLSKFSTWGQENFLFPESSLKALNSNFGSEVFAVDFTNDPYGTNLLIETWQSQLTGYVTNIINTTDKTRLAFSSANRLNSNWLSNPASITQGDFHGTNIVTMNYFDLSQNALIKETSDFVAGEFPLEKGNNLFLLMPHSAACPSTPAIANNALAFDHPFAFFVINNQTGLIIYSGLYSKPAADACDANAMAGFLSKLSTNSLKITRGQLTATQQTLYVPQFNFGYIESIPGIQPPLNSDASFLYFDHFTSKIAILLDNQGITISSGNLTAVNLHESFASSNADIKGVYVGQNMNATVGQEFGYQNFDNISDALALISKFGLTAGSTSGTSGWPAVFGTTTTDGIGF
ncbi:MAG: hypothetical protein HY272_00255 [Gammaproteobacteria bacterium]|nr:hypothetical protein [Gammaproteobacteria bacterium]